MRSSQSQDVTIAGTLRRGPEHSGPRLVVSRRSLRASSIPLALAGLPMILFLFVPLLALVLRVSPSDFLLKIGAPETIQAIRLSVTTTLISLAITLVAGTPLAYLLARRRFVGRTVLDTLVDLPIVLPPAVAGIALLVTFGRLGLVGQSLSAWGIDLAFTPAAVVMAQTFVAAPLYIKTAASGFAAVDREIEQASSIDGANALGTFRYITLPLSSATLFGGAVMTWARALGEFGATIIFAGNLPGITQTMPLAIYLGFELDLRSALTLSLVLLVLSFGTLLLVKGILRMRVEEAVGYTN